MASRAAAPQELLEGFFMFGMGIAIFSMSYITFNVLDLGLLYKVLWGTTQGLIGIIFMYAGARRLSALAR